MARDPSPLSQRLKALAVRAGLPVDTGTQASAAPRADDEQPTGEFPAVAASDTPDEDRPTGEFAAVTEVPPRTDSGPAAEPELRAEFAPTAEPQPTPEFESEVPAVPAPIWGSAPQSATTPTPPPVRGEPALPTPPAPIWTDAPPESQSPPDSADAQTGGPTLAPPTLSKPEQLDEALTLPEPEPEEQPTIAQPHVVHDLSAEPTLEPGPDAEPLTSVFGAVAIDGGGLGPEDPPADRLGQVAASDAAEPESAAEATTAAEQDEPTDSEPSAAPSTRERLGLTGRFAALRRRVAPSADAPADGAPTSDAGPVAPTPEPEPPATPVTQAATTAGATTAGAAPASHEPPAAKPSFSERAALRRRVKTLRARRDTGLLELGAIVLDQRRFGDPTAGALLRRRTDELGDLDNEIAAIEHALDDHASAAAVAALGAIRCVSCSSLVGPSDRFCAHCGTPRPTGDTPPAASPAAPGS